MDAVRAVAFDDQEVATLSSLVTDIPIAGIGVKIMDLLTNEQVWNDAVEFLIGIGIALTWVDFLPRAALQRGIHWIYQSDSAMPHVASCSSR